jgi:hypothetical protein
MKSVRILIAVFAAFAIALPLAGSVAGTANASAAAKPKREILDAKLPKINGKYVYHFKVADYARKRVVLERKTCNTCKYRIFKSKKTNLKGLVKFTLPTRTTRGRDSYRPYTPETVNFRKTYGPKATITCYSTRCR